MSNRLYTGIDVSLNTLVAGSLDSSGTHLTKATTYRNNLPATDGFIDDLVTLASDRRVDEIYIATEATGFLDWHLLEHLAQSPKLAAYEPKIYRLNPLSVSKFRTLFSQTHKTDCIDAFVIANALRFQPPEYRFNANMDYIPLQRLTRYRKHIVEQMSREKNYFLNHLFLKFSAFRQVKPFSNPFGATSCAFLSEFFSIDEVASTSVEDLLAFVIKHGKNRFANPQQVVDELKKVARESYRIRPALAESVNLVLCQTLANIRALGASLKAVNLAIEKGLAGFAQTLETIPGIGKVYAAGIFAEIGDISRFASESQLARYSGLAWQKTQSGQFSAEVTPLMRHSNAILRYYLVEAANSVKNHIDQYRAFYQKKSAEAKLRKHKRALVMTARKLVRLIYALLKRGEIYQPMKVN